MGVWKAALGLIISGAGCFLLTSGRTEEKARTPQQNYKEYCAGCHGERMDAFVDRNWKHGSGRADLFKAIKHGYPDEGMPGFDSAFTDKEIYALADYIIKGMSNVARYKFDNDKPRAARITSSAGPLRLDTVASGLASPWGLAFLPEGGLLITDRNGKMYRQVDRDRREIAGVPEALSEGQGGLMDVLLHPDFKKNGLLYLSYSAFKREGTTTLSTTAVTRARLEGDRLVEAERIFEALPYSRTRHHYGGRLEWGRDGMLYITVGDRGAQNENPQVLSRYGGKLHRVAPDGSIPKDNPFAGKADAAPSVYSYGHRNAQGMAVHPQTGAMWLHEHGPRGGDEINIIKPAANYGWPVTSYGINYNGTTFTDKTTAPGIEAPAHYWIPSIGPSGMAFITSDRYKGWKGHLLVGSLRFQYLNLCRLEGGKVKSEELLLKNIGRVREVALSPDGYIYLTVENPGYVFRLLPD